ncbi:MAG: hypothetical protein P8X58_08205 [Syntrophobacterales bacterium]
MPADDLPAEDPQSLLTDNFFYFFLRLRKGQVRKVVETINDRFPDETLEQRARRLIEAQTSLSFLGGALLHLPMLIPGLGLALGLLGFVGGASALTRMHLYLILEIALLYGKDIDDQAPSLQPGASRTCRSSPDGGGDPYLTPVIRANQEA